MSPRRRKSTQNAAIYTESCDFDNIVGLFGVFWRNWSFYRNWNKLSRSIFAPHCTPNIQWPSQIGARLRKCVWLHRSKPYSGCGALFFEYVGFVQLRPPVDLFLQFGLFLEFVHFRRPIFWVCRFRGPSQIRPTGRLFLEIVGLRRPIFLSLSVSWSGPN